MKKAGLFILLLLLTGISYGRVAEISNAYIKLGVDYDTGRLMMESVEGNPSIPTDNNKSLLYSKIPPTSITTVNVDGEFYLYGSDIGNFKKRPTVEGNKIISIWSIKDLEVTQEVTFAKGPTTSLEDSMLVSYKLNNNSSRTMKIGLRIVLDVLLGDSDPSSFGIPGKGDIDHETQFAKSDVPPFWYCFDNNENPVVRAQGTTIGYGTIKPDKLVFATWERFYDNPWELTIDSSKDFRRIGTSQYDSAVALYYDPMDIEKGKSLYYSTMYGIYGVSFFTEKDMVLSFSVPTEPANPPVPVSAELANTAKQPLDLLRLELFMPKGFTLGQDETNVVDFANVEPFAIKKALWNLNSGNVTGAFKVKVRATAWLNNVTNSIEAEKNFSINYKVNMGMPEAVSPAKVATDTPKINVPKLPPAAIPAAAATVSAPQVVVNPLTQPSSGPAPQAQGMSPEEKKMYQEIYRLDTMIDYVNKKYEIMMGIYKNANIKNPEFLKEVDKDIQAYEEEIKKQEKILSSQKELYKK